MERLTIPLRMVWEGAGHDTMVEALACQADDRCAGVVLEQRPRHLPSGAIRRLAFWGEHDQQTRAKGLIRL